jgi:hypothetical protein
MRKYKNIFRVMQERIPELKITSYCKFLLIFMKVEVEFLTKRDKNMILYAEMNYLRSVKYRLVCAG